MTTQFTDPVQLERAAMDADELLNDVQLGGWHSDEQIAKAKADLKLWEDTTGTQTLRSFWEAAQ